MTNKFIRIVLKLFISLIILLIMTFAKTEAGTPIIIVNMIGLAALFAVWKYKPSEEKSNNEPTLKK